MKFYLLLIAVWSSQFLLAQDGIPVSQQEVIYGRKDGMALTMQVLQPQKPIGRAVINLISGQWRSAYRPDRWKEMNDIYLSQGYTLFNVVHGSQPRYAVPDVAADVRRAVQFIRFHAKKYGIDPNLIGMVGSSSGGHLALLMGLENDAAKPSAKDSISQVSSRVQAVACFNPPTDFVNWGAPGVSPIQQKQFLEYMQVLGAFQFTQYDSARVLYVPVAESSKLEEMAKQYSPVWQAGPGDAAVLIWHGDKDEVVPVQQSQLLKTKLEAAGVPFKLVIKPGAGHEWPDMLADEATFTAWLDKYLKVKR